MIEVVNQIDLVIEYIDKIEIMLFGYASVELIEKRITRHH
jgi:hypothetical protein